MLQPLGSSAPARSQSGGAKNRRSTSGTAKRSPSREGDQPETFRQWAWKVADDLIALRREFEEFKTSLGYHRLGGSWSATAIVESSSLQVAEVQDALLDKVLADVRQEYGALQAVIGSEQQTLRREVEGLRNKLNSSPAASSLELPKHLGSIEAESVQPGQLQAMEEAILGLMQEVVREAEAGGALRSDCYDLRQRLEGIPARVAGLEEGELTSKLLLEKVQASVAAQNHSIQDLSEDLSKFLEAVESKLDGLSFEVHALWRTVGSDPAAHRRLKEVLPSIAGASASLGPSPASRSLLPLAAEAETARSDVGVMAVSVEQSDPAELVVRTALRVNPRRQPSEALRLWRAFEAWAHEAQPQSSGAMTMEDVRHTAAWKDRRNAGMGQMANDSLQHRRAHSPKSTRLRPSAPAEDLEQQASSLGDSLRSSLSVLETRVQDMENAQAKLRESLATSEMLAKSEMASVQAELHTLHSSTSLADLAGTLATSAKNSDLAASRLAGDVTKLEARTQERLAELAAAISTTQDELRNSSLPIPGVEAKAGNRMDGQDISSLEEQLVAYTAATEAQQAAVERCKMVTELVEMQVNALHLEHNEEVLESRKLRGHVDLIANSTHVELQAALGRAEAQTEAEVARVTDEVRVLSQDLVRQEFLATALHEGVAESLEMARRTTEVEEELVHQVSQLRQEPHDVSSILPAPSVSAVQSAAPQGSILGEDGLRVSPILKRDTLLEPCFVPSRVALPQPDLQEEAFAIQARAALQPQVLEHSEALAALRREMDALTQQRYLHGQQEEGVIADLRRDVAGLAGSLSLIKGSSQNEARAVSEAMSHLKSGFESVAAAVDKQERLLDCRAASAASQTAEVVSNLQARLDGLTTTLQASKGSREDVSVQQELQEQSEALAGVCEEIAELAESLSRLEANGAHFNETLAEVAQLQQQMQGQSEVIADVWHEVAEFASPLATLQARTAQQESEVQAQSEGVADLKSELEELITSMISKQSEKNENNTSEAQRQIHLENEAMMAWRSDVEESITAAWTQLPLLSVQDTSRQEIAHLAAALSRAEACSLNHEESASEVQLELQLQLEAQSEALLHLRSEMEAMGLLTLAPQSVPPVMNVVDHLAASREAWADARREIEEWAAVLSDKVAKAGSCEVQAALQQQVHAQGEALAALRGNMEESIATVSVRQASPSEMQQDSEALAEVQNELAELAASLSKIEVSSAMREDSASKAMARLESNMEAISAVCVASRELRAPAGVEVCAASDASQKLHQEEGQVVKTLSEEEVALRDAAMPLTSDSGSSSDRSVGKKASTARQMHHRVTTAELQADLRPMLAWQTEETRDMVKEVQQHVDQVHANLAARVAGASEEWKSGLSELRAVLSEVLERDAGVRRATGVRAEESLEARDRSEVRSGMETILTEIDERRSQVDQEQRKQVKTVAEKLDVLRAEMQFEQHALAARLDTDIEVIRRHLTETVNDSVAMRRQLLSICERSPWQLPSEDCTALQTQCQETAEGLLKIQQDVAALTPTAGHATWAEAEAETPRIVALRGRCERIESRHWETAAELRSRCADVSDNLGMLQSDVSRLATKIQTVEHKVSRGLAMLQEAVDRVHRDVHVNHRAILS